MIVEELRPSTRRVLRRQVAAGCALTIVGLVLIAGMVALLLAAIDRADARGEELRVPGAALPIVVGAMMVWHGLVEVPRRVRALRAPGTRIELRPMTAVARRRRFLGIAGHREDQRAWLVGSAVTGEEDVELAIPVDPGEAERMVGGTAALVRGRFEAGGRIVLDFPSEVVFTTGRVLPVAAGLPAEPSYEDVRSLADVPSRLSVRWRVAVAVALALLVVAVASSEEDGEDGERCGRLPGSLLDARSASCLDEAQFQVWFSATVGTGSAVAAWSAKRRNAKRRAVTTHPPDGPGQTP